MKIGSKLLIGFSINIIFLLIVTVVSNYYINTLKSDIDVLSNDTYKKIVWTNEILETKQKQTISLRSSLLINDREERAEYIQSTLNLDATIKENFDSLQSTFYIKDAIALLDKLSATDKSLLDIRGKVIKDIKNGNNLEAADVLLGAYSQDINSYFEILDEINNFQKDRFTMASIKAEENYKNSILVQIIAAVIAIVVTIVLSIKTTREITKPIEQAVTAANALSVGDMNVDLETTSKDETGQLLNAMKSMSVTIHDLTIELNQLTEAATLGRLDTRANENKFKGEYQDIIKGFNQTLDAVIGPLNITAEYVDRISKGDIPPKITEIYNGDFNEIKRNLNQCIDAVGLLIDDTMMLARAAAAGELDTRANDSVHGGDFNAIVRGFNNTLDLVIGPLNVTAEYVDRISKGDIPPKITENYNGDFNEIKNNLNQCIDAINTLVTDTQMLAQAAKEGRLDFRADETVLSGDFRAIIQGFNHTLDAVINPLNLTAEYVDRISKGDIPPKITENYNGDFNEIKNNLNQCIDAIKLIIFDVVGLTDAYSDGQLDYRIATNNHHGDYRKILEGINNTLDSVVNPFKGVSGYFGRIAEGDIPEPIVDDYKGDFHDIKLIINQGISAINLLVEDTTTLVKAMEDGNLSIRTDLSLHGGDFRKIIQGVNQAIDLVATPTNEISSTMSIFTTGDLTARINSDYRGDFALLKADINQFADTLSDLVARISNSVQNSANAALDISKTAEALATASQEQAAQADDVANAVEAMTRTITENAMSASRTAEVATHNSQIASESGRVVELTVEKMRDIAIVVENSAQNIEQLGESSKQIGEIISVIDDIADQTNLLALNAAIEAARAGEQGRGFAVVADEVRKLAERTTDATKQIANMIKGIQNETEQAVIAMHKGTVEVQSGIELADKAGDSLRQILNSTQEVLDMVNQIASASEEQSATSEEISKNVIAISKVTGEASRDVEYVAQISDELTLMTEELRTLVLTFKIDDENSYSKNSNILNNGGGQKQLMSSELSN